MKLIPVPPGRGRWAPLTLVIEGARSSPLFFRVGQRMELGGVLFRISQVLP